MIKFDIDEYIVKPDFNITDSEVLVHPKMNKFRLPIYDEEYCEALWNELSAEIEDILGRFVFEMMSNTTYNEIIINVYDRLNQFRNVYPVVNSFQFKIYIENIQMCERGRLNEILDDYRVNKKMHVETVADGVLYAVPMDNKIFLNMCKIIDYLIK